MSHWALVPVKGFERGKSRLSEVLDPTERAALTRKLFEHVVSVLLASPSVDAVAVVSESADARAYATSLGLVALEDDRRSRGLADVVDTALRELARRGATSALVCMSDLPELSVRDVEAVARELNEVDVILVPDRFHRGTNLIAVRPISALPSCLGHEDSLARHLKRAEELGLRVSVQPSNGIGFDVDRPNDLERLRRR